MLIVSSLKKSCCFRQSVWGCMKTVSSCLHKGQGWENSFTAPQTMAIKELCQLAVLPMCFLFVQCEPLVIYEVITGSTLEIGLSQENVLFLFFLINILKSLNFRVFNEGV